jgi:hypothetical protein
MVCTCTDLEKKENMITETDEQEKENQLIIPSMVIELNRT